MKRSTLILSVAALAVGGASFALLVPAPPPEGTWIERRYADQPEVLNALKAREAARAEREMLETAWRVTEARELARAARAPSGTALSLQLDARLPQAVRDRVSQTAHAEIAALGPGAPRHPIVLVAVPEDLTRGTGYTRSVILPLAAGEPCTIVMQFPERARSAQGFSPFDRLLGTCAFYAAFGAPGEGMRAWLLSTNAAKAGYLGPQPGVRGDREAVALEYWYATANQLAYRGCRVGRSDACLALFNGVEETGESFLGAGPTTTPRIPAPEVRFYWSGAFRSSWAPVADGLLAELAAAVGPRTFEAIWRGARSPSEEYERLAGEPLAQWTARHVAAKLQPYQAGPTIPPLPMALTLALILGAATVSIARSRRTMS